MMLPLHDRLRAAVRSALQSRFGIDAAAHRRAARNAAEPRRSATSARRSPSSWRARCARRRAPIAQELAGALGAGRRRRPRRRRAERLPEPLSRPARRSCCARLGRTAAGAGPPATGKTIVEHTAINPNKAAHIGHLRNAALGDTLVRVLRFRGTPVEVQNYIDDTGVQVADVVVGFRELEGLDLDDVPRARRHARASTTTAGTSTRASPSGTRRTRRGWRSAPRRCTTSSTAATRRADDRRASSPTASSAATWRRWRG